MLPLAINNIAKVAIKGAILSLVTNPLIKPARKPINIPPKHLTQFRKDLK